MAPRLYATETRTSRGAWQRIYRGLWKRRDAPAP